jgi:hypothetical protein
MSENGQTDRLVPPELSVMLDLYADEGDRDAIRRAYFGLAHGDPSTFRSIFRSVNSARSSAEGLSAARSGHPEDASRRVALDCGGRQTNLALRACFRNYRYPPKPDPQEAAMGFNDRVQRWRTHNPCARRVDRIAAGLSSLVRYSL